MPNSKSRLFTSNDLSYVCYSNLYSCLCANLTVTSRCDTFDIASVNAVYKSYSGGIANISALEAYSLSIESVLGSSLSTVEVLTKLNSFVYATVITGGLRDYNLLLETAAKLYYDWTTFDSLATLVTKLSIALINDTNVGLVAGESVTLEGNGFIYRTIKLNNATGVASSYQKLNITYSGPVTGTACMLLVFNRTTQGRAVAPVLVLY